MFDFPNAPTNGQLVQGGAGQFYAWDGAKWVGQMPPGPLPIASGGTGAITGALALDGLSGVSGATAGALQRSSGGAWSVSAVGGSTVVVSDTPPASPTVGSQWFDGVSATMFVWFNDGTSSQWVPVINQPGVGSPVSIANGGTGVTTAAAAPWVEVAGDSMSGPLVVSQNAGALPAPTQPSQLRLAAADGVLTMMTLDAFGTAAAPYQVFRAARGTAAARTALSTNDPLGGVQFYGAASAAAYGIGAMISVAAAENWTATANGAVLAINTVAPGTTTLSTSLALGRGVICGAAYSAAVDPGPGGIYQTGPHTINQNAAALPAAAYAGLQVAGANGQPQLIYCTAFGGAGAPNAQIRTRMARGTAAAPAALQTSDWFGVFSGEGSTGATTWASPAKITMIARENWTPTATGSYWVFENTPVGSTTLEAPIMLGRGLVVGGNISNDPGVGSIYATGSITISNNTDAIFTLVKPGVRSWSLYSRGSDGAFAILDGTGVAWRMEISTAGHANFTGSVTAGVDFRFDANNYFSCDRGGGLVYMNAGTKGLWTLRSSDNLVYNNQGAVAGNGGYINLACFEALKSDIRPILNPVALIEKLKPVAYTLNATREQLHGFIIEDMVTVYPETLQFHPDTHQPIGIKESVIIAGLTAAVQELASRVQALEAAT